MSTGRRIALTQDHRPGLKNSATILGASRLPVPMVSEMAQAETVAETPKQKSGETLRRLCGHPNQAPRRPHRGVGAVQHARVVFSECCVEPVVQGFWCLVARASASLWGATALLVHFTFASGKKALKVLGTFLLVR